MKIQRGIVKYKDRNDIVCTYALTDDGKQYYFLDETDAKKFSNGNRIASTALVEAIDPMAKASNVGVIDQNGAIVVPFENRSIRPVNDNVIVIEKANPTSQSVIDANELRSDPTAAQQLVSTPATIKDRINAQMGTEGKYIFNDQFSEATVCDINGTNLVGGESYSFISNANDKLYLAKNTVDTPINEFSLTTYEMLAPEAIDVAAATVDQNVVEDALQGNAEETVPTEDVVMAFDDEDYALRMTMKENEEKKEETQVPDVVMAFDDEAYAARHAEVAENAENTDEVVPVTDEVVTEDVVPVTEETVDAVPTEEVATEENVEAVPTEEVADTSEETVEENTDGVEDVTADLNAFVNGAPAENEVVQDTTEEVVDAPEETGEDTTEENVEDNNEITTDEVVAENTDNFVVNYDDESAQEEAEEEYEMPPVVEEDAKNEVTEEETKEEVAAPVEEEKQEESFSDLVKEMEKQEPVEENKPVTIDAETVLATVDRNNNGIIDSDEIMVPQKGIVSKTENQLLSDIFNEPVKETYDTTYTNTTAGYDPMLDSMKTDRIYDGYGTGNNIMADIAKSMTDLMKQNKDQKAIIAQYKAQITSLESQTRMIAEKFKDQSMRYEALAGKLRSLDEATGRLESRNQLLESRVRDQEKIIASQDRELKSLRPQVQGNQDLVRILADAKSLLDSDNSYGYNDGDSYYRGRAA